MATLTAEDGWLSLIGLYRLRQGQPMGFGIGSDNDLVLPARPSFALTPETLGTLEWTREGPVVLRAAPDAALTIDGAPAGSEAVVLRSDRDEEPSLVELGTVELTIIERAGEQMLRASDRESERRTLLHEIPTFPPSSRWVLDADFEPAPAGSTLEIVNVLGQVNDEEHPGTLLFELDGSRHRIDALATETEGRYFLLIGDQTNGVETYGGGRYLYVERRPDGGVDLDLNRLYNPPCVFTEFATCPLPPRQNRLALRIEAGEKTWEHH